MTTSTPARLRAASTTPLSSAVAIAMLLGCWYLLPRSLPLPARTLVCFALRISSHNLAVSRNDFTSFVLDRALKSSATTKGNDAENWCPLFFTSSAFPVAASADRMAFLRSLSLIFSLLSVSGLGGCTCLPLTACGILAALLPFIILATRDTPLPGPHPSADVLIPAYIC